jgi:hypothetical protein
MLQARNQRNLLWRENFWQILGGYSAGAGEA